MFQPYTHIDLFFLNLNPRRVQEHTFGASAFCESPGHPEARQGFGAARRQGRPGGQRGLQGAPGRRGITDVAEPEVFDERDTNISHKRPVTTSSEYLKLPRKQNTASISPCRREEAHLVNWQAGLDAAETAVPPVRAWSLGGPPPVMTRSL